MAKYFLKCKCGSDNFKYIKEVNLYTCTKCNHEFDPNFDIGEIITKLTNEELKRMENEIRNVNA